MTIKQLVIMCWCSAMQKNAIIAAAAALERWPLSRDLPAALNGPDEAIVGPGWIPTTHQPTSLLDMQDTCRRTHIEGSLDTWSAHYKGGSQHECGYLYQTSIFFLANTWF